MADLDSGPFFYLSKVESASEARLWDQIFTWAENRLGLKFGMIDLWQLFIAQSDVYCSAHRYHQELRLDRKYFSDIRNGVYTLRITPSLHRIKLRHLGLFGLHYFFIWYSFRYCFWSIGKFWELKFLFDRSTPRICHIWSSPLRQHRSTFFDFLHQIINQGVP
jgi:hypothetical protein